MRKLKFKSQIPNSKPALEFWSLVIICNLVFGAWNLNYIYAQDKIIAIVNTDVITQKDIDDFVSFMRMQMSGELKGKQLDDRIESLKQECVDRLVEDKIILQEARKNKLTVDEARVKARIAEIKRQYPSDIEFQEALKSQGMVQADLETKIREQMLMYNIIDAEVRTKVMVSPVEVTDYYQKNVEQFKSDRLWEFDAVALEAQNLAFEFSDNLKKGEPLEDLANKCSLAINKLNMKKGEFKKEVEDIVFELKPQGISEPVKIENKYYIFRLNNIVPEHQQTLSEAQDSISNFLYNKKMQESMTKWLDELKKQSYIKIID